MGLFGKNDKGQKPIEIQNTMEGVSANGHVINGINNRIEQHITYQKPTVVLPQPPPPVDEYCGREADAVKVLELLDNSHAVLVHTWGGIGKTEFALKLAQDRFFGKAVFFDCSNSVDTALANCTSGTTDYNQQVACAVNELREKEDWLAVFDNIQSAGDAAKVLERFNSFGIMLLMTARQNFNTSGCGKYELPTVEDGAELFRRYHIDEENGERRAYSEEELSCVNEIVRLAGGHTLTLELLAKTCRASGRSVFDILNAMEEKGFSLEGIAAKVTRKNADEAHRFIEHLEKLYDIAGVVENHSELIPLMKKLCVLDVSDTPSAELIRWCVIEDNDSLNELARLGWLREKALRYTMHNVVSEVLKRKLEPSYSDIEDTAEAINNELIAVWNDVERSYTPQPVQLQAKALLRLLKEDQPLLGGIANNAGLIEREQGRYAEALDYYKKALAIREKVLGKEHPSTATTYNNIAGLYHDMGDHEQALEYYKKALAIREKVLGQEHPSTATTYNNIALLYKSMGEYEQALDYYKKALEIYEKVLGKEHPDTATMYNNVAGLYRAKGEYTKALEYYKKDLAITEKVHGKEHPYTATTYNNIALLYKSMGDHEQALDYYKKALAICEKVLGKEHPYTATTYNNIAVLYRSMGEYKLALEYYKKDLAITEKVLGKEHPSTATTYNNIALLYQDMGDHEQALDYYKKALAIREKVLGKEHPDTAITYNNIAGLYQAMGDHEQALGYFKKALAIDEKVLGKAHPSTATTYHNIAALQLKLENLDDAARYFAAALKIYSLRNMEKDVCDELEGLIMVYSAKGGKPEGFQAWLDALLASPELP